MSLVEKRIKQILIEKRIPFEELEHQAVFTCEEAARVRGLKSAREGIKCLIFKTNTGRFLLVLNSGDQRIDTKRIARMEGVKNLDLAEPEEVEKIAGVPIGCVPPFALKKKVKTYLNEDLLENESLYFNPGSHTKTIQIRASDLLKILDNPVGFKTQGPE
jgi:prolyl-tRNA editing enzyme YbaK/EbsC (Cys-tRNA(Pro) deacylase)